MVSALRSKSGDQSARGRLRGLVQKMLRSAKEVSPAFLDALHPEAREQWTRELVPGLTAIGSEPSNFDSWQAGFRRVAGFWNWFDKNKYSFRRDIL